MIMKKLTYLLGLGVLLVMSACVQQTPDFPDFDYTAVYFPHQYPVRTLSLGEDRIDNSLDRELKFNIGVGIGGLRENTQEWQVGIEVDPALAAKIVQANGDTIKVLPPESYSLSNTSNIAIPSGSFSGLVQVQMQDSWLNDPLAWGDGGLYVIPMRITSSNADSILSGLPVVPDPDKRVQGDWDAGAPPKDFTLFAIKYVNEYHGAYLHRGFELIKDANGEPVDTIVYRAEFVVQDELWNLQTAGRFTLRTSGIGSQQTQDDDLYQMDLVFNGSNITVEAVDGSIYQIAQGSGTYASNADSWGGEARDAIYLSYSFTDTTSNLRHEVNDTLVFRDRGISFETFSPTVVE